MKKKILFAATEAAPLVNQTSLASFNGMVPKELSTIFDTAVILPFYPSISPKAINAQNTNISFTIPISDTLKTVTVWKGTLPQSNVTLFLLANKHFDRDGIYGNHTGPYPDNSLRFTLFSKAVVEFVHTYHPVDIIVASDWYTALIPVFLKEQYQKFKLMEEVKAIISIFDLNNQGRFWVYDLHNLNLGWDIFTPEKLEFYNQLNFLKGGVVYADTIFFPNRPTLDFLQDETLCHGLQGILQFHLDKLRADNQQTTDSFITILNESL